MKFHDDHYGRPFAGLALALIPAFALASCGTLGGDAAPAPGVAALPMVATNGPQADYPVTIGQPYNVDGRTYTPADVMNYDEVGFLAPGSGVGIVGAHHTLPFPSYVEVTSLETGRTVLVRIEQRGPMDSQALIALSPAALAQLGAANGEEVRVRRVNPPESQRAILRAGQSAPLRMDTPMSLVSVLRRGLPGEPSVTGLEPSEPPEMVRVEPSTPDNSAPDPGETEVVIAPSTPPHSGDVPALPPLPDAASPDFEQAFVERPGSPAPAPAATSPVPQADANFVVQAAAFASEDNARRAAASLGGEVSRAGRFYRVRTGPFATRAQAEASLANVHAAGYEDARIFTLG